MSTSASSGTPADFGPRVVVGCMTGTSIDGLDAAMVRIHGHGLAMSAEFVRGITLPLGDLAPRLKDLADQRPMTAGAIAALSRDFALLHGAAVRELLCGDRADLICVHGQTVYHAPPVSWQMFNSAVLAYETGTPVVFDLRAADLAAGGQGAPITPIADWFFFRAAQPTAVVNLGGFCNITLLPRESKSIEDIEGFDVCACNHVLNAVARVMLRAEYDRDGAAALSGSVHSEAAVDLEGVLASQSRAGRSLGTGDEVGGWISRFRARVNGPDLAATACEVIGQTIARRVQGAHRILVAGGGARNAALVKGIRDWSSAPVQSIDTAGVPIEFREAAAMGVLGALCRDRVPITLPRVTGLNTPAPVAGAWVYP